MVDPTDGCPGCGTIDSKHAKDRTESEPKNYLCWDVECGWRIYGIEDIKQAIEHQHYAGYGQPTKYFELDDECGEQYSVTLAFLGSREDHENDYFYSDYRLGGEVNGEWFTVAIDGRA